MLWYGASIFLLLLGCWQLSRRLFSTARARWSAVAMVAALLTLPVAGTALYIMDQYTNPRNLAAFAGVFAITRTLERKYVRAGLWLVFAGSVHPLMAVFAFSFCSLWIAMERFDHGAARPDGIPVKASLAFLLPVISLAPPTSPAYHAAAMRHGFHYIQFWKWYEVLGAIAPAALFWWFGRIARARQWQELHLLCRALIAYNLIYFIAALIVDFPARFESLARLQPLRSLHLLYILMFVVIGGLAGEFVLKDKVWRWLALFIPLSAGMFAAQRALFPANAQVEWPGAAFRNPWEQAFFWIRGNTPADALFALDPLFMQLPGEGATGFRCLAQRSRLADDTKDSGAVSMFPPLAEKWWAQVRAQSPWQNFRLEDFARLKQNYGVTWVVVQQPSGAGMECDYQNGAVKVCRLP